jgi:phosphohistidine phosphatase
VDLWLMRHAEAEDRSAFGKDEDRRLTARGTMQATAAGRFLSALEPDLRLILTSPYRRARDTSEAVARALPGSCEIREEAFLEPDSDPDSVLTALDDVVEDRILLVGHAPLLGVLLGRLVTGDPGREIPVGKAGIAAVAIEEGALRARLRAFLPARVIEGLASRLL